MKYVFLDDWITRDEMRHEVSHYKHKKTSKLKELKFIILHYTAGDTIEGAIDTLVESDIQASAHIIMDRDGIFVQTAPFNVATWHAGRSSWEEYEGINKYSIGIEIVNNGKLTRYHHDTWKTWYGKQIPLQNIMFSNPDTAWETYPPEQIEAVTALCVALVKQYPSIEYILGHSDIAPGRKIDPGPALPVANIAALALGRCSELH